MKDRLGSIVYPSKTDQHMIVVETRENIKFDADYKYVGSGFLFRFLSKLLWLVQITIGAAIMYVGWGARVRGRKNLRLNKAMLKSGAISVCTHVHMFDAVVVASALCHQSHFPVWDQNCRGSNRFLIKYTGGIPVPNNPKGLLAMNRAFDSVLSQGKWVHFFPEGSMWWYFKPIRPFKKAAFGYAVKHNVPIIPMSFSYRKPTGIYKMFGKKDPLLTLNVGVPFMPDSEGTYQERVEKMRVFAETECARLSNSIRFANLPIEAQQRYQNPNGFTDEQIAEIPEGMFNYLPNQFERMKRKLKKDSNIANEEKPVQEEKKSVQEKGVAVEGEQG